MFEIKDVEEGGYELVEKVDTEHKYKLEIYEGNSLEQETTQVEMIGNRIHLEIPDMGFYSETEKELEIVIIDLTSSGTSVSFWQFQFPTSYPCDFIIAVGGMQEKTSRKIGKFLEL